jgi:dUTP pyrophosphatase
MKKTVKVRKVDPSVVLPDYGSPGSAGADIRAHIPEPITIAPFARVRIPTGLFLEIPEGYEGQIRPRSGLAYKHGVTVLNAPGTIDSDYRGELQIILINLGNEPFTISSGDRIAQLVVTSVLRAEYMEMEELGFTERGTGGFGSTGT